MKTIKQSLTNQPMNPPTPTDGKPQRCVSTPQPTPAPYDYDNSLIIDKYGNTIADCDCEGNDSARSYDENLANAAFICRAVNCHDELVGVLQMLKNLYEGIDDGGEGITGQDWLIVEAALDKAKCGHND